MISGSTNKKAKKICWVHMGVIERGSQLKEFKSTETAKPIYEKFDLIAPVSQACAEKFKRKFGNDYPYTVVRNPLPVSEILCKSNEPLELPKQSGISIVCIGRLVEQKGFDRLLEVCKRLLNEGIDNYKVYIVGDGPQRGNLDRIIARDNLTSYVELAGYQTNPYTYLKQADVFLLSSRDESFSLVIGESLIVGTPVIATDCSGVSEWLESGKYGMIVDNSVDGIYQGVAAILRNPELINQYRTRIPEAQAKISFEQALTDFEKILV